ncbi:MAG: hypothetical protein AB8B55_06990 [Mariniblastus sp.]
MPNSKVAKYSGWVAIGVAVIFAVMGFYGYAKYARFQFRVEALKDAGELVSLSDIEIKVAPENDILTPLTEFEDEIIAFGNECPHDIISSGEFSTKEVELFESLLEKHPGVFPAIDLASTRTEMSFAFAEDAGFNFVDFINVRSLLDWKARVQRFHGKQEEAAKTAIQLLDLSEHCSSQAILPLLLGRALEEAAINLVSEIIADEEESGKTISRKLKDKISKILEGRDPMQGYRTAVKSQRAFVINFLLNPPEPDELAELYDSSSFLSIISRVKGGGAVTMGNELLDQMEALIEHSEEPLSSDLELLPSDNWVLRATGFHVGFAMAGFRSRMGELVVSQRALRILLALSQDPESAERTEWSPEYLIGIGVPEEMTVDPFNEAPMNIRRVDGRWQIYSVGENKVDDSGERPSDVGLGLIEKEK